MMISRMDSVEISLLTCSPHEAIYSLYGHTAIRINDQRNGEDLAVNYGLFSFEKPHFVLRFLFGLTDYEMGIEPFEAFCRQYRYYGSSVTQQVLNLTNEEKWNIVKAVNINYMPENSVYRYNYFYDNCTTRAVDMLTTHLADAHVVFEGEQQKHPSFREMVHGCLPHHPWNRFGNDMLLGVKADCKTTLREHQFLPANAMDDFRHAMIVGQDGSNRPLVLREEIVVPEGTQDVWKDFPLSPKDVFLIVLAITVLITLLEAYTKKVLWGYDALLMILCGLAGIVLFLMLFSQHPTVSLNLQFILFNPIHWLFLWPVIRRKKTIYWKILTVLCVLFLIGALFQSYAEGIWILALCLL
ncbi:MAG: DUF4105 domain-containing protein, partial [Prevotella sp.]|nr:DUF4105 domain-containing protein [Prevotella sp.]